MRPRPTSRLLPTSQPRFSRATRHYLIDDDLCILANAVKNRRLVLAHPVHSNKVEARYGRATIGLNRKSHLIEYRKPDPVVVGTVSARPDDSADLITGDVELCAGLDP